MKQCSQCEKWDYNINRHGICSDCWVKNYEAEHYGVHPISAIVYPGLERMLRAIDAERERGE